MSGGTIRGYRLKDCAIAVDTEVGSKLGKLTISGCKIEVPSSFYAVASEVTTTIDAPSAINGIVLTLNTDDTYKFTVYGHVTTTGKFEEFYEDEDVRNSSYVVSNGAIWDITSTWEFVEGTVTNVEGTLINKDKFVNNGIINNAGTIDNNNTGTIDNTNGTIDTTKGKFYSAQSKEEMGGTILGEVLPHPDDQQPSPDPDPQPSPGTDPQPSPGTDTPNVPPSVIDNTTVEIVNSNSNIVAISVITKDGAPIPPGTLFYVWLLLQQSSQNLSARAEPEDYNGPFIVESKEGTLEIDVNDLKKPDGTKASIAAGLYIVKFIDKGGKYIGTTKPFALEDTNVKESGGGGCDTGYGLFGLLLAGFVMLKCRKA
jgi:hypothetical protein